VTSTQFLELLGHISSEPKKHRFERALAFRGTRSEQEVVVFRVCGSLAELQQDESTVRHERLCKKATDCSVAYSGPRDGVNNWMLEQSLANTVRVVNFRPCGLESPKGSKDSSAGGANVVHDVLEVLIGDLPFHEVVDRALRMCTLQVLARSGRTVGDVGQGRGRDAVGQWFLDKMSGNEACAKGRNLVVRGIFVVEQLSTILNIVRGTTKIARTVKSQLARQKADRNGQKTK
jgi:hypothetical protein